MKNLVLTCTLLMLSTSASFAMYTIDGNVTDWGIDLNAASHKGYLDTHTPTGGNNIDFVTEDNVDKFGGTVFVGPGYAEGNVYDAEALYFDNNATNAYIALITGTPRTGIQFPPGDIFIDTGKYQDPNSATYDPKKYEYAIKIGTSELYRVGDWEDVHYNQHASANPWRIGSDDSKNELLGAIDFVFGNEINSHYVLEASVPLAFLGLQASGEDKDVWLHWTMMCGNDVLKLHGDVNAVPEPATMALLGSGLFGCASLRRKRKRA